MGVLPKVTLMTHPLRGFFIINYSMTLMGCTDTLASPTPGITLAKAAAVGEAAPFAAARAQSNSHPFGVTVPHCSGNSPNGCFGWFTRNGSCTWLRIVLFA